MLTPPYIGRFAPTPSGPLHFGSIIAALGSYLQARKNNGQWLVRIEDIDLPRTVAGADKIILEQLEHLGLFWDGEVVYQSKRIDLYEAALETLNAKGLTFLCTCTRKETANKAYPGTCRNGTYKNIANHAIRIKTEQQSITVDDLLQGAFSQDLASEVGDFIIKRSDDLFAYHLAVVVDDAEQQINEIVRGVDLLDSTPRQIFLQQLLGYVVPRYLHLPLAIDKEGKKISKQDHATAIEHDKPLSVIFKALEFLGQSPPIETLDGDVTSLLSWAIENWDVAQLPKAQKIKI